jgi:hypothetical protein
VGFYFLGTDGTDKIGIGNLAFWGNVGFGDEENSTGASDAVFWRAIQAESMREEMAPFVRETMFPYGSVRAAEELLDGALFSCRGRGGDESNNVVGIELGDSGAAGRSDGATAVAGKACVGLGQGFLFVNGIGRVGCRGEQMRGRWWLHPLFECREFDDRHPLFWNRRRNKRLGLVHW